jgi:hypothetical protein
VKGTELLSEVFRRSDVLLAAWAVHTLVAVGVLALVLGVPAVRDDRRARRLLAAAFAFLAVTNLEGMHWVLKQWAAATAALKASPEFAGADESARAAMGEVIEAPHLLWVVPFHLIVDAFVLWVVLRPGRPSSNPPSA